MKLLISLLLLLLLSFTSFSQSIQGSYEFKFRENRTPNGWDKVELCGEVIFYEDKDIITVTIVTSNKFEYLYVKSRQLFVKNKSYIYTLVDDDYNECSFRIIVNDNLNILDFYYYSNRVDDKYYKLKLTKCY
jgi:hypothetical protein